MKAHKITLLIFTIVIAAACGTGKKATTTATTSTAPVTTSPQNSDAYLFTKPSGDAYPPGNEELAAIQLQYKEVTMEKLKQGHVIYTQGACMGCHGADNIYKHSSDQWKMIIDDMAARANITAEEKDAVYKYVLSIKAKQPN